MARPDAGRRVCGESRCIRSPGTYSPLHRSCICASLYQAYYDTMIRLVCDQCLLAEYMVTAYSGRIVSLLNFCWNRVVYALSAHGNGR